MNFYRTNSSIATAVDCIASAFEQITPVLQTEDDKFINDHDVLSLLKRPNGFQTWQEFAGMLSRHYLITADSHITALGIVANPPIEIYSVKPLNVTPLEDFRDSFPKSYMVVQGVGNGNYVRTRQKKEERFYASNLLELYHIMGFSSRTSNTEGDSLLQAAALEARQQIEGRVHNLKLLRNGGRLSLIFNFKGDDRLIDDDEHQKRKDRINEDFSGSDNASKIAVISGTEVDIEEVGKTPKDMDYAKLDESASYAVYLRYKIPLALISMKASTFNNLKTGIGFLYDVAVLPHADIMFAGLSKMLLPRYGLDPSKVRITYDPDSITALKERLIDLVKARKEIGAETPNEIRALLAREPVEGGDILYQPANLVAVGEDLLITDNTRTAEEMLEDEGIVE